jgi:Mrp family chromosome partitioning ATPase
MPLFLTIPRLRLPSSRLLSTAADLEEPKYSGIGPGGVNGKAATALWERNHGLRPFHEALRDRLLNFFEVREVTHKPKLVAVTSCAEGAGVSSIATGLAAALSETGDVNVLLVDMKTEREAAHSFSQGKPVCGLAEALESDTRGGALVQQNLYVVSANNAGDKVKRVLPRKFSHFMPKLMASDYDYVIFDMPPISQTSITGRIAKYMDMIFIVIESEKTDREVAKRAAALLAESKAKVATIFNRSRDYVPAWLHQEFH